MVGHGRLLVVNITVEDSGSATWVHHCIRTSAMTRCIFTRIIFLHELGRSFFLLLRFFPYFSFSFSLLFFFFWNATAYFAQFAIRGYASALTAGGCLAETSDDSAAEEDVALPGCGTTNRAMRDAALSLTFSLCFLPSM